MNALTLLLMLAVPCLAGDDPSEDYRALPSYLDTSSFLSVLHESAPRFGTCFDLSAPPAAITLDLQIAPAGNVSHARAHGDENTDTPDGCVEAIACSLIFPPHDEPQERWTYTVAWAKGQVHPFPQAKQHERPRRPLFLLLPAPPDAAKRQAVLQQLGFDPSPPELPPLEPACPASTPPAPDQATKAP